MLLNSIVEILVVHSVVDVVILVFINLDVESVAHFIFNMNKTVLIILRYLLLDESFEILIDVVLGELHGHSDSGVVSVRTLVQSLILQSNA